MEQVTENSTEQYRSVYVVEDDWELYTVIERVLRNIDPGIHLNWTTRAEDALLSLRTAAHRRRRKPYDLIVADIFLEGRRTGLDLWEICQLKYPKVPMVVTSGLRPDLFLAKLILRSSVLCFSLSHFR